MENTHTHSKQNRTEESESGGLFAVEVLGAGNSLSSSPSVSLLRSPVAAAASNYCLLLCSAPFSSFPVFSRYYRVVGDFAVVVCLASTTTTAAVAFAVCFCRQLGARARRCHRRRRSRWLFCCTVLLRLLLWLLSDRVWCTCRMVPPAVSTQQSLLVCRPVYCYC